MFISNAITDDQLIERHKLGDHPIRVGSDPQNNGYVMAEFGYHMSCSHCYDNGNDEGGKDHDNAQWFPYQAPADVFE